MEMLNRLNNTMVMVIAFFLIVIVGISLFFVIHFGFSEERAFCTTNDTVYQAFVNNIDSLKSYFPPDYFAGMSEATRLNVPGRRRVVVVRVDYSSGPGEVSPIIYVTLLEAGTSLTTGVKGYMYSANPSNYWNNNYKLTKLDENFYCYSF